MRTLHTENMNYQRKVLKFLIASQKFSTVCILVTSTFRPLAKWIWKHMLNMPVKEHPLEMQIELCLCMLLCLVLVAAHFTCVHLKQTMPKWPFFLVLRLYPQRAFPTFCKVDLSAFIARMHLTHYYLEASGYNKEPK